MKNLLILLIIPMLFSCKAEKEIQQSNFRDRVVIVKERDTIAYTKPDTATLNALIKCDSAGNAYIAEITNLKNGRGTRSQISLKNSQLQVDCIVDSMAVYLQMSSKYESTNDSTQTVITIYKEREKKLRFIDRLLNGIIAALLFIVIFTVVIYIFRLWISWRYRR